MGSSTSLYSCYVNKHILTKSWMVWPWANLDLTYHVCIWGHVKVGSALMLTNIYSPSYTSVVFIMLKDLNASFDRINPKQFRYIDYEKYLYSSYLLTPKSRAKIYKNIWSSAPFSTTLLMEYVILDISRECVERRGDLTYIYSV